jgi:hypothetical protein
MLVLINYIHSVVQIPQIVRAVVFYLLLIQILPYSFSLLNVYLVAFALIN